MDKERRQSSKDMNMKKGDKILQKEDDNDKTNGSVDTCMPQEMKEAPRSRPSKELDVTAREQIRQQLGSECKLWVCMDALADKGRKGGPTKENFYAAIRQIFLLQDRNGQLAVQVNMAQGQKQGDAML